VKSAVKKPIYEKEYQSLLQERLSAHDRTLGKTVLYVHATEAGARLAAFVRFSPIDTPLFERSE